MPSPSAPLVRDPRKARLLRWLGRGLLVAGVIGLFFAFRTAAPGRGGEAPARAKTPAPPTDWLREPWARWTSRAYGLSLERPASWTPHEPFEQMTAHPIGDLEVVVVAGFRGATPVVVYRYRAPRSLSWKEWRERLHSDRTFRYEFGARIEGQHPSTVSGQPALEIDATGATGRQLWRYRSLFFARGPLAFRVTAGADARQWDAVAPTFERILRSADIGNDE